MPVAITGSNLAAIDSEDRTLLARPRTTKIAQCVWVLSKRPGSSASALQSFGRRL